MARIAELPGLQAERTLLSWDRTALGLLGTGALLLFRDAHPLGTARLILGGAVLLLAVLCALARRRRAKRIGRPTTATVSAATATVSAARLEVAVLGTSVAALGVVVIALSAL
jgi:putative membrane protein